MSIESALSDLINSQTEKSISSLKKKIETLGISYIKSVEKITLELEKSVVNSCQNLVEQNSNITENRINIKSINNDLISLGDHLEEFKQNIEDVIKKEAEEVAVKFITHYRNENRILYERINSIKELLSIIIKKEKYVKTALYKKIYN